MKIGFLKSFPVCDSNGNEFPADIFAVEGIDEQGRKATTVYAFEEDGHNPAPGDFEDYEQEAWLEKIQLLPVDEDDDDDDDIFQGSLGQIWEAITDCLRGLHGPCPAPSVPYMRNDENQMSERDRLANDYFKAVLFQALRGAKTS